MPDDLHPDSVTAPPTPVTDSTPAQSISPDLSGGVSKEVKAAMLVVSALSEYADDEELIADMIEGETNLFQKLSGVLELIARNEEVICGIKKREDELAIRKNRLEKSKSYYKAIIEQALTVLGLKTINLPEATLTLKKNPAKMVIKDEQDIPSQYYKRQDPKLDKRSLTAALKALGEDDDPIPGVVLEDVAPSLQIRRS